MQVSESMLPVEDFVRMQHLIDRMNSIRLFVVAAETVDESSATLQSENSVVGTEMFAVDKENSVVEIDYAVTTQMMWLVVVRML